MKLETSMDEVVRAGHATQVAMEQSLDKKRNSAIKGAVFSEFIDMFDIYLPVIILAPIQSYLG